ncbi:uncharacterized protein EV422DRAFT_54940 [Fimicolochytrium jonesii]|uniref:uncharacterized protein n=1 Tax=Fimicolochytrium jonesii TaxID=1396493 RepID=UPI0022FEE050|nr:uncharacterized protein EV422DRAFT_54940 [Fimicolochytrium jonesii]KAI8821126.1 hypothetical protein EV422DRAFT_54940 [Fimicolochytrium jonesii]
MTLHAGRIASISTIPHELLLRISDYLDADTYLLFRQACQRIYNVLGDNIDRWTVHTNGDDTFVTIGCMGGRQQVVRFAQTGDDLTAPKFDREISSMSEVNGIVSYNRLFLGLRKKGHRAVAGGMPLYARPQPWNEGRNCRIAYYEVTILEVGVDECGMEVGLGSEDHSFEHPPGSVGRSVGYCSDDGSLALGHRDGEHFQFAAKWGKVGDVVGCGYVHVPSEASTAEGQAARAPFAMSRAVIFFTLNGHWVGDAPHTIHTTPFDYRHNWFPVVSAAGPCHVGVNLGEIPFRFTLANDALRGMHRDFVRQPLLDQECPMRMVPNCLPKEVADLPIVHIIHDIQQDESETSELITFPPLLTETQNPNPCSAISTFPIDLSQDFQFTVKIISAPPSTNINPSFLSLGFAPHPCSSFYHIGWEYGSIGYHTDDGRVYQGSFCFGRPGTRGVVPAVEAGSVLMCRYRADARCVTFMQDGLETVGSFIHSLDPLHVAVAAGPGWAVQITFASIA